MGTRLRFWNSPLWAEYNHERLKILIAAAKSASTMAERCEISTEIAASREMTTDISMIDEIHVMAHLFRDDLPLSEKIGYVLSEESETRLEVAKAFPAIPNDASQQNFDWSELELFVTVPEETPVIDFDSLSRIMKLVLSCDGRKYVTNPMLLPLLDLTAKLIEMKVQDQAWALTLLKAAAHSRLGAPSMQLQNRYFMGMSAC